MSSEFSSVLINKKVINGVSYARFSFKGTDRPAKHGSCVIYKVEAGEMDVIISGQRTHLKTGQRVTIEADTPYFKEGSATIFARDIPPFNPETVVYLD